MWASSVCFPKEVGAGPSPGWVDETAHHQVTDDPNKGGDPQLRSSLTRPPLHNKRLSASTPQSPASTRPFFQEHGSILGVGTRSVAAQIRERNLGTAKEHCSPLPAAGDSASRPAQLGLQRCRSPRASWELQALRALALPRTPSPPPYHGCSPGRAGSAWTAPEGPAAGAARGPRSTAGPARRHRRVRTGRGRGPAAGAGLTSHRAGSAPPRRG